MSTEEEIRERVSETYARAVSDAAGGCCGPSSRPGVTASSCGYQGEELAGLPADAVQYSFGCGDPLAFAEVKEGETVLDLGSGAGIDLLLAARKVGDTGRVIGVDMTDAMIAKARANIAEAGHGNVEVRKGIIEQLPVEDASVDWLLSNCVINLSPDKPRVFAEIARVLKPGGRMSVSDIVASDLPASIRNHPVLHGACVSGAISEEEYLQGLKDAGLEEPAVIARMPYDASTIRAFFRSPEFPGGEEALSEEEIERYAALLEGKVASVRITARRAG